MHIGRTIRLVLVLACLGGQLCAITVIAEQSRRRGQSGALPADSSRAQLHCGATLDATPGVKCSGVDILDSGVRTTASWHVEKVRVASRPVTISRTLQSQSVLLRIWSDRHPNQDSVFASVVSRASLAALGRSVRAISSCTDRSKMNNDTNLNVDDPQGSKWGLIVVLAFAIGLPLLGLIFNMLAYWARVKWAT
jgi:hypothetical protein